MHYVFDFSFSFSSSKQRASAKNCKHKSETLICKDKDSSFENVYRVCFDAATEASSAFLRRFGEIEKSVNIGGVD